MPPPDPPTYLGGAKLKKPNSRNQIQEANLRNPNSGDQAQTPNPGNQTYENAAYQGT